jgi:hypothetical protein
MAQIIIIIFFWGGGLKSPIKLIKKSLTFLITDLILNFEAW